MRPSRTGGGGAWAFAAVAAAAALAARLALADAAITYVDATTNNTARADGAAFAPVTSSTAANDTWVLRGTPNTAETASYANGGYVFQAIDASGGGDPPELVTTLTAADGIVAGAAYEVFAYFWDTSNAGQDWRVRAGLSSNPGGNTLFRASDTGGVGVAVAEATDFAAPVPLLYEDPRTLYQASLGAITATGGILRVYVDDQPNTSGSYRSWYDGVGFRPAPRPPDTAGKPNVLLICVDDLRPETRAYGAAHMITPNLDRLAADGRLFRNHFCQAPTCGASRYALFTGLRYTGADAGSRNNEVMWSRKPASAPAQPWTMVDLFRRNGYRTVMTGKISHSADGYHYDEGAAAIPALPANEEMPFSWDEIFIPPAFVSKWGTGWKAFFGYADGSTRVVGVSPPMEIGDPATAPAPIYPDIAIADAAIVKLRELQTNRFFLAVGFYKPHLPFAAPREYFDLYTNALPFSPNPEPSIGVSSRTQAQSGEPTNNYGHDPQPANWDDLVNTPYHAELRRAYYACVSFVDAQVGRVLDEVDRLGLATNTVVVLWGDHGWHLGDHNLWGKHTKYERAARSALIVRTPDLRFRGHPADALVESVDIYPTLADLCRLTNPPPPAALSGVSLAPVLNDPRHPGKDGAITYWEPASSLRTDRHRLIYYHDNAVAELFDHATDPWEATNVAGRAGNEAVVSNLVAASISNAPALRVAPDHYRAWVTNRFAPAAYDDSNTVGRLRDPDGDGHVNVFEYFHGTSPTSFTADVVLAPAFVESGGLTYFGARFPRSLEATDLGARARARAALTAPSGDAVDPDDPQFRVSRTVTGTVETITVRDLLPRADSPRRFIHLELDWQE